MCGRVEVIHGDAAQVHSALASCINIPLTSGHTPCAQQRFGLVFIDHTKERYLPDLQNLVASGLLAPGCVIVADNICFAGEPHAEYLNFVRQPVSAGGMFASSVFYSAHVEYSCASEDSEDPSVPSAFRDGVEVSQLGLA